MATRSNNLMKIQRLKEVRTLLVLGRPRHEIVFELSGKWKCSERNVDKYLNICKQLMQKAFDEETIAELKEKYDFLFENALMKGDDQLAKQIVDSKMKLKGIVDKVEVTVKQYKTDWGEPDDKDN